jgi:hypothetical protein
MKYLIGLNLALNDYEIMQETIKTFNSIFNRLVNPDFLRGFTILHFLYNRKYLLNVINTVR